MAAGETCERFVPSLAATAPLTPPDRVPFDVFEVEVEVEEEVDDEADD